jgi:hypothetical protein
VDTSASQIHCAVALSSLKFLVALRSPGDQAVIYSMNATKSREVIWGGRIMAAKISAERARKRAVEAVREADRAEARGGRGPCGWKAVAGRRKPSPAIA